MRSTVSVTASWMQAQQSPKKCERVWQSPIGCQTRPCVRSLEPMSKATSKVIPEHTFWDEPSASPELEAEIDAYAQTTPQTSSQNQEEYARVMEENRHIAESHALPGQRHWYLPDSVRSGRKIHSAEFITILRDKFKLGAWTIDSDTPGYVGLWLQRHLGEVPQFLERIQVGWMPEYQLVEFDYHGLIAGFKGIGWRTLLLNMILKRYITEDQMNVTFGRPYGPAAVRTLEILRGLRNGTLQASS